MSRAVGLAPNMPRNRPMVTSSTMAPAVRKPTVTPHGFPEATNPQLPRRRAAGAGTPSGGAPPASATPGWVS